MANPFQSILPGLKVGRAGPSQPTLGGRGPVASYKRGVKFVPKTGIAKLEKGETVLNKKDAKKYRSAAAGALGSGKKKPSKTQSLIQAAGHELKTNPPKILAKTAKKKGAAQANKQKIAIMLSKARAAGADIPEKGE
jgi:hypothetical protein